MADFQKTLDFVMSDRIEGGYQKYSQDSGNYNSRGVLVGTNFGISAPKAEEFMDWPIPEWLMRNMSKDFAKSVYHVDFWFPILGDFIESQGVATAIFDGAVNHGLRTSVRMAQEASGASVDGIFGPATLRHINNMNPKDFIEKYIDLRKRLYKRIVKRRPSQSIFLNGWMNRLDLLKHEISAQFKEKV